MNNKLTIFLISVDYVKENSSVLENVEESFIKSHITESQNIHIQNIIGTKLYEAILNDFNTTTNTFDTAKYKTIVDDYIQPCLMYYTLYECLYDLFMKFTNKGVVLQTSDNSASVSSHMLEKRRGDYQNKAEFYSKRLIDYLLDNDTDYPEYLNWTDSENPNSQMEPEFDSTYFNGLYLGDGKRRKLCLDPNQNNRFRKLY